MNINVFLRINIIYDLTQFFTYLHHQNSKKFRISSMRTVNDNTPHKIHFVTEN